jgi:hypothetical protein
VPGISQACPDSLSHRVVRRPPPALHHHQLDGVGHVAPPHSCGPSEHTSGCIAATDGVRPGAGVKTLQTVTAQFTRVLERVAGGENLVDGTVLKPVGRTTDGTKIRTRVITHHTENGFGVTVVDFRKGLRLAASAHSTGCGACLPVGGVSLAPRQRACARS